MDALGGVRREVSAAVSAARGAAGGIGLFVLKFFGAVAVLLVIWWTVQPQYIWVVGQTAGLLLRVGGVPLEAMRVEVDEAGILNTLATLVYVSEGRDYPIDVAFIIAGIPPFIALVLATPELALRRRLLAIALGTGILAVGHIAFLSIAFGFHRQVERSPELPTAFGLFVMTLPFILWIALVYRDRIMDLFENPAAEDSTP